MVRLTTIIIATIGFAVAACSIQSVNALPATISEATSQDIIDVESAQQREAATRAEYEAGRQVVPYSEAGRFRTPRKEPWSVAGSIRDLKQKSPMAKKCINGICEFFSDASSSSKNWVKTKHPDAYNSIKKTTQKASDASKSTWDDFETSHPDGSRKIKSALKRVDSRLYGQRRAQ
ncbi:hypothetical protein BDF19DRAFT_433618 [Syncephalis fuscata]|nr:hypothetical protein BDF19DRAFT_433618 [Syncephalis fuscata]